MTGDRGEAPAAEVVGAGWAPGPALEADLVLVGSGIAGLSAALGAAASRPGLPAPRVLLLTPGRFGGDGASWMAQGGIAAALAREDSPALHALDTRRAGAGLTDAERVEILAAEGPDRVRELVRMGVRFDRDAHGALALGLEGAHSRRRIVHALGDRTGWEVTRVLAEAVLRLPNVRILESTRAHGLMVAASGFGERRVEGVRIQAMAPGSSFREIRAPLVLLATGGSCHLYLRTTAPTFARGDGLAMALDAGARLDGMEFVQFHPTALRVEADPLPLVTEALRGEGARLVDALARPLPGLEDPLAARDRVARALWASLEAGIEPFLDARAAVGEAFPRRFPGVWTRCREHGIDPMRDLIPVTPAAHYHMGGIAVDAEGRSSVAGLRAAGEVASTGIHGANRLASNSLLEGLVYGRRAGVAAAADLLEGGEARREVTEVGPPSSAPQTGSAPLSSGSFSPAANLPSGSPGPEAEAARFATLRTLLWQGVGVVRDQQGIRETLRGLDRLAASPDSGREWASLRVARVIAEAALTREESVGSHLRSDDPRGQPGHGAEARGLLRVS